MIARYRILANTNSAGPQSDALHLAQRVVYGTHTHTYSAKHMRRLFFFFIDFSRGVCRPACVCESALALQL